MKKFCNLAVLCLLCLTLIVSSGCGNQARTETTKNDFLAYSNFVAEGNGANLKGFLESKKDNFKAWQKTAGKGLPEGQVLLGLSHLYGVSVRENPKEAVNWFRKAATQGFAEGQYQLGKAYFLGEGIEQDQPEGVKWLFKAKEQEHTEADALFQITKISPRVRTVPVAYRAADEESEALTKDLQGFLMYYRKHSDDDDRQKFLNEKSHNRFDEWKGAAEKEIPEGQILLGLCYRFGVVVPKNMTESVKWFRKAAEQEHPVAQQHLGWLYFAAENPAEAVKWFRKAAEHGLVAAQSSLGACYSEGWGVEKNEVEAVKWYRKAAEQGDALAQYSLGVCCFYGEGVPENKTEAVKWYRKAAEQGNALAQYSLGLCYNYGEGVPENKAEAVKWYRKAAEQGNAHAIDEMRTLGLWEENDSPPVVANRNDTRENINVIASSVAKEDLPEGINTLHARAEQGNAEAQFELGKCYLEGAGVLQDDMEAIKWIRKAAAEQGHAGAQWILGMCYYNGIGLPRNYEESVSWFRKAAEQGLPEAQNLLAGCYSAGHGVRQDWTEAVKWFRKAAEQGQVDAQADLGGCYLVGIGVSQNTTEGLKWIRKAAEQGNEKAIALLREMERVGLENFIRSIPEFAKQVQSSTNTPIPSPAREQRPSQGARVNAARTEEEQAWQTAIDYNLKSNVSADASTPFVEFHTTGSVNFSPDGKRVVVSFESSRNPAIMIWDIETRSLLKALEGKIPSNANAFFSPDGKQIFTTGTPSQAWDAESGKELKELEGHTYSRFPTPAHGKIAVRGSSDGTKDFAVRILNAETREELKKLEGHTGNINTFVFSPDGKKIVTGSTDKTARIWDVETGKELQKLEHAGSVKTVAFSPDGKKVVTGSWDKTARIWDTETGKELQKLEHTGIVVETVAFAPDGKKIFTRDGVARIWDAETGKELQKLIQGCESFVVSSSGKEIVTGNREGTVQVWDVKTGQELINLGGFTVPVSSVVFSPDEKKILAKTFSETRIWDLEKLTEADLEQMSATTKKDRARFAEFVQQRRAAEAAEASENAAMISDIQARIIAGSGAPLGPPGTFMPQNPTPMNVGGPPRTVNQNLGLDPSGNRPAGSVQPQSQPALLSGGSCPACNGSGTSSRVCTFCNGSGLSGPANARMMCMYCNGKRFSTCGTCQGTGKR